MLTTQKTTRKASTPPTGRSQLRTAPGTEQVEVPTAEDAVPADEVAPVDLKPEFPTAKIYLFGHAAFQLVCMRNDQLVCRVCRHGSHAQRSTDL